MSIKGKIPPELKIQAVEDYLAIRKGSTQIREELGIRLSTFQSWVRKYQTEGRSGLYPKKHVTNLLTSVNSLNKKISKKLLPGAVEHPATLISRQHSLSAESHRNGSSETINRHQEIWERRNLVTRA